MPKRDPIIERLRALEAPMKTLPDDCQAEQGTWRAQTPKGAAHVAAAWPL